MRSYRQLLTMLKQADTAQDIPEEEDMLGAGATSSQLTQQGNGYGQPQQPKNPSDTQVQAKVPATPQNPANPGSKTTGKNSMFMKMMGPLALGFGLYSMAQNKMNPQQDPYNTPSQSNIKTPPAFDAGLMQKDLLV